MNENGKTTTPLMVRRVLSQRCIGYNISRSESVFESTVLLTNGETRVQYGGLRTTPSGGNEIVEYGTRCPTIDTPHP